MIDFEFFDKYLNKEEKGFIDNADKITLEVINYLKKTTMVKIICKDR